VRTRRFGEARDAIERALVLDPLNPRTWRAAGMIDFFSNRPREAVPRLDRALELNPSMSNAQAMKGYSLIMLGRWAEARKALDGEPTPMFRLTGLAILGGKTADKALAQKSFAELESQEGDARLSPWTRSWRHWPRNRVTRPWSVRSGLRELGIPCDLARISEEVDHVDRVDRAGPGR
jgi:hypothetical protein